MMTDEKLPPTTSASISSSSTTHEKSDAEQATLAREAMKTDAELSEKPLGKTPSVHDGDNDNPIELKKTKSAADIQQEELNRVHTSAEGVEYPTGVKLQLISLALCLSVFLMALDNSIIATAIPKITDQFHSLNDVGWYGSAYLLTTASFQLLFGKFYSYFSIKWVYLVAIAIFELGSLICGVAPNSIALIIGRAIAGLGSAGIFSGALIIVAYSVPLVKRPMYTGLIGAMYGIASVAGPLLGGVFTDKATWRWCFLINLPIGAVTVLVILIFFKAPDREAVAVLPWSERIKEFDLLGTAFFIPAIICLLLALQWGGTKYPWGNGRIIALFVLFGVLIGIFIAIQFWKGDSATVPPSIMKKRSMWSAAWFSFCLGSYFLLLIYYLPIWFQAVKGDSAVKSGISNIPMVLTLVIVSIISGALVTTIGYYAPLMIVSSVIASIGIGLLTTFKPDTNHAAWIGYQCLAGIGIGFGMQQPLIACQTVLDISQVPTGTSVIIFVQTLGGALFVSIGQNVFTNKLAQNLAHYVPDLNPAVVLTTGATSIQKDIAPEYLAGVTISYNNALTQSFLVAAVMAALTIIGSVFIEWKSVKGKKIEMAAA
ncbi:Bcmfs1 [Botrytis cinerea B05.10]|uniref:Bcmfs1 n=3 Tax=Botryotinia fuckeliana TaxID=40559 RepID=A0A384J7T2_BOTFB|nr:Bcmfs1 [Botrytis cinerea B05.10]XP_024546640.1 Bcmfs1 [Botrytis cinerea B05.10]AAF64435.2 DHA14-like major facilitator [Botrytis cinerea]EMR81425.1 putative mfs transporter protein [Botrytis cinerea BcDW1]ATZ46384.1 Bcmfs1 [Botrytis cinerea B05.10]ATZ46385.1 Bcmfs1 [Botrytis cinerea B05.10]